MIPTMPTIVTRRQYRELQGQLYQRRQTLLRQLSQAAGEEYDRLWNELGRSPELPKLPTLYVYMLYEPDDTYMGTVRTRAEVRQLKADGIDVCVRQARDLHEDHRPVTGKYRRLYEAVRP